MFSIEALWRQKYPPRYLFAPSPENRCRPLSRPSHRQGRPDLQSRCHPILPNRSGIQTHRANRGSAGLLRKLRHVFALRMCFVASNRDDLSRRSPAAANPRQHKGSRRSVAAAAFLTFFLAAALCAAVIWEVRMRDICCAFRVAQRFASHPTILLRSVKETGPIIHAT